MVLAIETSVEEGNQCVRLGENLLVIENGFEILGLYPHSSKL